MSISNQDNNAACIQFDLTYGIEFPTISGVEGGGDVINSNYVLPLMNCVSMGNPHTVFFVDDVQSVPLKEVGSKIEKNQIFPNQTNVEFAEVIDRKTVKIRVWERGTGITLACGTGACGMVIAGILTERLEKEVTVILDGGELNIDWTDQNNSVFMTGPATEVFSGTVDIKLD